MMVVMLFMVVIMLTMVMIVMMFMHMSTLRTDLRLLHKLLHQRFLLFHSRYDHFSVNIIPRGCDDRGFFIMLPEHIHNRQKLLLRHLLCPA